MNKVNLTIPLALAILFMIFNDIVMIANYHDEVTTLKRDLDFYEHVVKTKTGASEGFGSYQLISVDGGKIWYESEREQDNPVVDTKYGKTEYSGWTNLRKARPELLKRVETFEKFLGYVKTLEKWQKRDFPPYKVFKKEITQ